MKKRALVADDNKLIRSTLSLLLERKGYEVITCPDPTFCEEFIDLNCQCPSDNPCADIIITDINMPNMTGLEFIENIKRKDCKVNNIAVISGSFTGDELEQAQMLGYKVFKKPFKTEEIREWIDACEKGFDPNRKLSDIPRRS